MTFSVAPGRATPERSYDLQAGEERFVPPAAEEPAAEAASEVASSDYGYGHSEPAGGMPAYISDEELLLWMQAKSQELYGQVRDAMDLSTERSKLMQDLTHLKGQVDSGAPAEEIMAEMEALRAAYAGTVYEPEIAALCADREASVEWTAVAAELPVDVTFTEAFSGDIQAEIDKLGRDDQLALVQIQNLMSNIRETSQLASNILASRDQASNSIVGNIRG